MPPQRQRTRSHGISGGCRRRSHHTTGRVFARVSHINIGAHQPRSKRTHKRASAHTRLHNASLTLLILHPNLVKQTTPPRLIIIACSANITNNQAITHRKKLEEHSLLTISTHMPSHNMKPSEHAQKAVYPSQDIIPAGDRQLGNTLKSISIYDTNFYTTSQAHRGKAKRNRVLGHNKTDHTRIHMQNTHQNIITAP